MNGNSETFLRRVMAALHDCYGSLGEFAWIVVGPVQVAGLVASVKALRWVWRGGLSRQRALLRASASAAYDDE